MLWAAAHPDHRVCLTWSSRCNAFLPRSSAAAAACPLAAERSSPRGHLQISLSSFAYLFSELVQYCQSRVSNISELERK